jgi:hypothetical protein
VAGEPPQGAVEADGLVRVVLDRGSCPPALANRDPIASALTSVYEAPFGEEGRAYLLRRI